MQRYFIKRKETESVNGMDMDCYACLLRNGLVKLHYWTMDPREATVFYNPQEAKDKGDELFTREEDAFDVVPVGGFW